MLGRLIGSAATGGVIGWLAWYLLGSTDRLRPSLASIVSVFTLFGDSIFAASRTQRVSRQAAAAGRAARIPAAAGGGGSGSSEQRQRVLSGGGGSFGGGGASGSW